LTIIEKKPKKCITNNACKQLNILKFDDA